MNWITGALCLTFLASLAQADTYHVSPGGEDSQDGSREAPWRTLQSAVMRLRFGDVLEVHPGTYSEHVILRLRGTEESPITIRSVSPGKAKLAFGSFRGEGCSHLRLEGFLIEGTRERPGIEFTGQGRGIVITGNEVTKLESRNTAAVRMGGRMHHFRLEDNHVHHNRTGNQEAIRIHERTHHFEILNNWVHDNSNIGIDIVGWAQYGKPHTGVIRGNLVENNGAEAPWSSGIYVDGAERILIEFNRVTGSDIGFQLGCEPAQDQSGGHVLRHNLAFDCRQYGLSIGGYTGGTVTDCQVYNNVFANNQRAIGFSKNAGSGHILLHNILVEPNGPSFTYLSTPKDTRIDFNSYLVGHGATPGANSLKTDPQFTNPEKGDFSLSSSSPCIGAGSRIPLSLPEDLEALQSSEAFEATSGIGPIHDQFPFSPVRRKK